MIVKRRNKRIGGDTFYLDGEDRESNGSSPSYRERRSINTRRPHAQPMVGRRHSVHGKGGDGVLRVRREGTYGPRWCHAAQ
jgi:hypothetical protein